MHERSFVPGVLDALLQQPVIVGTLTAMSA